MFVRVCRFVKPVPVQLPLAILGFSKKKKKTNLIILVGFIFIQKNKDLVGCYKKTNARKRHLNAAQLTALNQRHIVRRVLRHNSKKQY